MPGYAALSYASGDLNERDLGNARMAAVIERVTTPSTNGHAKTAGATSPVKPFEQSTAASSRATDSSGTAVSTTPAGETTTTTTYAPMRTLTRVVPVETTQHLQFLDITDDVTRSVADAGIQNGFAVVFSRHTTAGIRINEHEPLLLEDMTALLERMVPEESRYRHDDFSVRTVNLTEGERINGHSHCRSLLLGASEAVPVAAGQFMLGRWQRIFLVELDGPRSREFVVQVVGA